MDMEGHLGVPSSSTKISKERDQANNIDIDVDTFAIGQSKRLQRVFYEVVPEGEVGHETSCSTSILTHAFSNPLSPSTWI